MKLVIQSLAFSLLPIIVFAQQKKSSKMETDFSMEISSDHRYFFKEGLYANQKRYFGSIAFQPEFDIRWDQGEQQVVADVFGRLSSGDSQRSHWDIRELYYQISKGNWEISAGLKKVYWGVTESVHLVDVINQTDQVESFDGEQKLGQPMVQASYTSEFGTFEAFLLPYHRYRTLPGEKGRLRFPVVIDDRKTLNGSGAGDFDLGGAFRYSHYFGVFDIGLSYIYHRNREFLVRPNINGELVPFYEKMHQLGIDLQATTGAMLWKLEGINRFADSDDFQALVVGGEYTFGNIGASGIDLGLLVEFLYDNRKPIVFDLASAEITGSTGTAFQKDLFAGGRLAFNDTQDTAILFGALLDLEQNGKIFSIEGERRLGQDWKIELELRILSDFEENELFYFFRDDSFSQLTIARFF